MARCSLSFRVLLISPHKNPSGFTHFAAKDHCLFYGWLMSVARIPHFLICRQASGLILWLGYHRWESWVCKGLQCADLDTQGVLPKVGRSCCVHFSLRNPRLIFILAELDLRSHQQTAIEGLLSSASLPNLIACFLRRAILAKVRWNLESHCAFDWRSPSG